MNFWIVLLNYLYNNPNLLDLKNIRYFSFLLILLQSVVVQSRTAVFLKHFYVIDGDTLQVSNSILDQEIFAYPNSITFETRLRNCYDATEENYSVECLLDWLAIEFKQINPFSLQTEEERVKMIEVGKIAGTLLHAAINTRSLKERTYAHYYLGRALKHLIIDFSLHYKDSLIHSSFKEASFNNLELASKLVEQLSNQETILDFMFHYAVLCHYYSKDNDQINHRFIKLLEAATEVNDSLYMGLGHFYLGVMASQNRHFYQAKEKYEKAVSLFKQMSGQKIALDFIEQATFNIGMTYQHLDFSEKAIEYYNKSVQLELEMEDYSGAVWTMGQMGVLSAEMQDYAAADSIWKIAIGLVQNQDLKDISFRIYTQAGVAYSKLGFHTQALPYFDKVLDLEDEFFKNGFNIEYKYLAYGSLAQVYYYKAKYYFEDGLIDQSLPLALKAYEYSVLAEFNDFSLSAQLLKDIYEQKEDYLQSNFYANILLEQNAKTLDQTLEKTVDRLEFDKQVGISALELQNLQTTNDLQLSKLQSQKYIIFIFVLMLLTVIIFTFFTISISRKNKQLANKELVFRQMRDNLFANISHEFRTPLTILNTSLNEMRKKTFTGSYLSYSEMMYRNVDNLARLTNQMLDLAKMSENQIVLKPRDIVLKSEIRFILSQLSSLANIKRINLLLTAPVHHLTLSLDKNVLQKIVQNLVYNAIKFTPKDGQVEVKLKYNQQDWVLIVSDTGQGIEAEKLPRVFDRYFHGALDENRPETGGLGLALTKQLVNLCEGKISVKSQLEVGTEFTVVLPHSLKSFNVDDYSSFNTESFALEADEEQIHKIIQFSTDQMINAVDTNTPLVLVVEDDPDLNFLLYQQLSKQHRVIRAFNGKEALQRLETDTPNIILTDIMMPGMNGIEFVEKIMTDINYSHIPVIVLSALESGVNDMKLWKDGVVDFVNKPYDAAILQYKIANQLQSRQQFKEKLFEEENWTYSSAPINSVDKEFLQTFTTYIEKHIEEEISVEEISKAMALSRYTLYNKVKSLTGYTPTLFIRKFRLNKAKDYLDKKVGNVSEVAMMVGYPNISQFSRIFKEEFGCSPSALLKTLVAAS